MRNWARLVGLALAGAAACSTGGGTAPATTGNNGNNNTGGNTGGTTPAATVSANPNQTFTPAVDTIAVGSTVGFAFGSLGHNVTFNNVTGKPDDIPGSNANTTITREFDTAGTFPYQCTIHAGMTGTIIVR